MNLTSTICMLSRTVGSGANAGTPSLHVVLQFHQARLKLKKALRATSSATLFLDALNSRIPPHPSGAPNSDASAALLLLARILSLGAQCHSSECRDPKHVELENIGASIQYGPHE